jgi:hypothetical protein
MLPGAAPPPVVDGDGPGRDIPVQAAHAPALPKARPVRAVEHAVLCYAMLCCAVLCYACYAPQADRAGHRPLLLRRRVATARPVPPLRSHAAARPPPGPRPRASLCCALLRSAALCCALLRCAALRCSALHAHSRLSLASQASRQSSAPRTRRCARSAVSASTAACNCAPANPNHARLARCLLVSLSWRGGAPPCLLLRYATLCYAMLRLDLRKMRSSKQYNQLIEMEAQRIA